MAQIFISHSSRDEGLVHKFSGLLQTGLGIHDTDAVFVSSVPGRDVDTGNVHEHITKELAEADLAIFIVSPNFLDSRYCWAEVGAAFATGRDTLLLLVPPATRDDVRVMFEGHKVEQLATKKALNKVHSVVAKIEIERTDQGAEGWETRRDEFIEWFESDYELASALQERVEEDPHWRDRGHWSASIVDGTIYIGNSGYVNENVKTKIVDTIAQDLVLPTVYAYLTNAGFHNWLRLTQDESYEYYADSRDLLRRHAEELADKISDVLGTDQLDLISLGPGDGAKDVVMLRALTNGHLDASALYYYPFDVNPSMISRAMETTGGIRSLKEIQVKAILADFASLPQFSAIYQYRKAPNVLTLLGNTLGNLSSDQLFLEQIYSGAMSPGDLFLLEVRKAQESAATLRTDANKEFDFGPLEQIGVPFEPEKLHYTSPSKAYSLVANTSTILATYESITYEGEKHDEVKLALIHEYDPLALKAACEDIGFNVLWREEHLSAAALLLQK